MGYHAPKTGFNRFSLRKATRDCQCFICEENILKGTMRYIESHRLSLCEACMNCWISEDTPSLADISRSKSEYKSNKTTMNTTKEKLTFNIGGVDYLRKATYKKSDCIVIDCFGGANQKCKIEMWNETVITVGTDELELIEAK